MKRALAIGCSLLLLSAGLLLILKAPTDAPRFERVPGVFRFPSGRQSEFSFNLDSQSPFPGGWLWILAKNEGHSEVYLFDLDHHKLVGRLVNGIPVMAVGDRSRVLCYQTAATLKQRLRRFLRQRVPGLLSPALGPDVRRYWLLDPAKNSVTRLGQLPARAQMAAAPSPNFLRRYSLLAQRVSGDELWVFDLGHRSIERLAPPGWPRGWWDNQRILCQTTNQDFLLYDVTTRDATPVLRATRLGEFFRQHNLPGPSALAKPFGVCRDGLNDFYLSDIDPRSLPAESYLIKIEHPDGRLRLLSTNFPFEVSNHQDPEVRFQLHSGAELGHGGAGIFLRDLKTGDVRVLAPPIPGQHFGTTCFYCDTVIYLRGSVLWQVRLDGSHNTRLFPPP